MASKTSYIKTKRTFTFVRGYGWLITVLVAIGGQFVKELGLLVPFMMVSLILTSLFKGKYFCGQFCPHGSFFDTFILPFSRNKGVPALLKSKAFIAFFFLFFLFNLGRRFFMVIQDLHQPYQQLGFVFSSTYLLVMILGGLIGLIITSRAWCHFCPMGTMQLLFYKLGERLGTTKGEKRLTIKDPDLCYKCGKCAKVCPLHLIPYQQFNHGNQFHDKNCIRCYTCVKNCPANLLFFSTKEEGKKP